MNLNRPLYWPSRAPVYEPVSRWERFKKRWAPLWFTTRWPVRTRRVKTVNEHVMDTFRQAVEAVPEMPTVMFDNVVPIRKKETE